MRQSHPERSSDEASSALSRDEKRARARTGGRTNGRSTFLVHDASFECEKALFGSVDCQGRRGGICSEAEDAADSRSFLGIGGVRSVNPVAPMRYLYEPSRSGLRSVTCSTSALSSEPVLCGARTARSFCPDKAGATNAASMQKLVHRLWPGRPSNETANAYVVVRARTIHPTGTYLHASCAPRKRCPHGR